MAWGNNGNVSYPQTMRNYYPDPEVEDPHYVTLEVNDVHDPEDEEVARIAILGVNSGTNAGDRALKVEGRAEIVRNAADDTALTVANSSADPEGLALKVDGKANIFRNAADETALIISNTEGDAEGRALLATGISEIVANNVAGSKALIVTNPSGSGTSKAMEVTGQTTMYNDQHGDLPRWTLEVEGNSTHSDAGALNIKGVAQISGPEHQANPSTALFVSNNNANAGSYALRVLTNTPSQFGGQVLANNLDGNGTTQSPHALNLGVNEETGDVNIGRFGESTNIETTIIDANCVQMFVGRSDESAFLDSGGSQQTPQDLNIGTQAETGDIYIGRSTKDVNVLGDLTVNGALHADGQLRVGPAGGVARIDANAAHDLQIGTLGGTDDVVIGQSGKNLESASAKVDLEGELRVGPTSGAGKIDSGGVAGSTTDRDLYLGTQTVTQDVYLGRSGQTTLVNGAINVTQTSYLTGAVTMQGSAAIGGSLAVGPTSGAASIDAGGNPTAQNLNLGSGNATANVNLGRSGQVVDVNCAERVNGNEVIMNGVANLANGASAGFVYNSTGHGNGKSIDFYIDGSRRGYIDALGWH